MKRRKHQRERRAAQSSPACTLTGEEQILQAAEMVERKEVKEHGIPTRSSERQIDTCVSPESEEEQITLALLHSERTRRGAGEGDKGIIEETEVGDDDYNAT